MNKRSFAKILCLVAALAALSAASTFAADLELNNYLGQVEQKDASVRGSSVGAEGYSLLHDTGSIVTTPNAFLSYNKVKDEQQTAAPIFMGTRNDSSTFTAGVSWQSDFGLNAKYSYNMSDAQVFGVSPQIFPEPFYNTAFNRIELTQSLVKNGFGSQVRAERDKINAGVLAGEYNSRFQRMDRLVKAESAFWRLAFARRTVEIQTDIIQRSEKALKWAEHRVNMQLGDKSDRLEAQAAYDLHKLEMQGYREEALDASRSFNLYRGVEGTDVTERLVLPNIPETISAGAPSRGQRLDILAAEQQEISSEADAQDQKEKLKPTVDLVANIAWTGRDTTRSEAISQALTSKNPYTALGINVSVPLALGMVNRGLKGEELAKESARLALEQQHLDERMGWAELNSKLKDAQTRLSLLRKIEEVQHEKYENEHQRLLRGRTTTFQALQYEQDYDSTQLNSLRTQQEVLGLLAQMKLYQGDAQ